jgi:hypothetical protein
MRPFLLALVATPVLAASLSAQTGAPITIRVTPSSGTTEFVTATVHTAEVSLTIDPVIALSPVELDILLPMPTVEDMMTGYVTAAAPLELNHEANIVFDVLIHSATAFMERDGTESKPASDVQWQASMAGRADVPFTALAVTPVTVFSAVPAGTGNGAIALQFRSLVRFSDEPGTHLLDILVYAIPNS